jgi:hypothetical protein
MHSVRGKNEVMRATKKMFHKLQVFVELLHDGVYGVKFVQPSQTPSSHDTSNLKLAFAWCPGAIISWPTIVEPSLRFTIVGNPGLTGLFSMTDEDGGSAAFVPPGLPMRQRHSLTRVSVSVCVLVRVTVR